ncbi:MAG: lnt: apolipoprotein n-acyltransferase [Akkermansiaceae bacterium]|nr:lnt: apolipoprotein n-acyltransferase [Akkermansiaceae bacterium]
MRKFARDAPQVIVNVTNDGWFKESIGAEQHFANARFRAIELRRPLIRCANSGVTAAVDTLGLTRNPDTGKPQELRDEDGKTFFRGHLFADIDIPKHPQWTLYSAIGDWGVIGAAVVSWLWAMLVARRNRPVPAEPLQSFG